MAEFRDRRERVEAALDASSAAIARVLLEGSVGLREDPRIRRLAREGRIADILDAFRAVADATAGALQEQIVSQATALAAEITSSTGRAVSIDLAGTRLVETLRAQRARLADALVTSQGAALRAASESGRPEDVVAAIGLSAAQVAAILRYRTLLEAGAEESLRRNLRDAALEDELAATLDAGDVPDGRQRRGLVAAYAAALLSSGALALGEGQGLIAAGEGIREAVRQAQDAGVLALDDSRTWRTRRDERVRGSHRVLHGTSRPAGVPFRSGDGNLLLYPGDPSAPISDRARCRCVLVVGAGVLAEAAVA